MEIVLKREMNKKGYLYKFKENIVGKANYTFGLFPKKIEAFQANEKAILIQTNWFIRIINNIPLLNFEEFTPFRYYKNGIEIGKSKKVLFKPLFVFYIKNDVYILKLHNDNYITLMKNDKYIAQYKRSLQLIEEKCFYHISFEEDNCNLIDVILFCIFVDIIFYANNMKIGYYKREKNIVIWK